MSRTNKSIIDAPVGAVATIADDAVTQSFPAPNSRYELGEQLHAGPTTTVWRARDTVTGKEVVLKRLEPASAADPIARQRFDEEAATLARMDHPNAMPLTDRVIDETGPALVFPFYPGRTLAERVAEGPLDAREAARIARDIADVLAAAHAAGVIHRDVKPANILIGDDGRCRLIDFGIARSLGDGVDAEGVEARLELTGSGMAIGTLPYMAPEQLTGSEPSPAADVYALGAVLYETLSGRRPYGGTSPAEHLALQHEMPDTIDAPDALAQLTYEMLDPVPENRPTMTEINRALTAWLVAGVDTEGATANVPVVAMPAETTGRTAGRRRAFVLAGTGASLAAVVLIGAALSSPFEGTGSETGAPASDPGIAAVPTAPASAAKPPTSAPVDRSPSRPAVAPTAQPTAPSVDNTPPQANPPRDKHKGKGHAKPPKKKH